MVGVDDAGLAATVVPRLTTIRQPLQEMGRVAVSLLWRVLEGRQIEAAPVLLSTQLIVRESTAPLSRNRSRLSLLMRRTVVASRGRGRPQGSTLQVRLVLVWDSQLWRLYRGLTDGPRSLSISAGVRAPDVRRLAGPRKERYEYPPQILPTQLEDGTALECATGFKVSSCRCYTPGWTAASRSSLNTTSCCTRIRNLISAFGP